MPSSVGLQIGWYMLQLCVTVPPTDSTQSFQPSPRLPQSPGRAGWLTRVEAKLQSPGRELETDTNNSQQKVFGRGRDKRERGGGAIDWPIDPLNCSSWARLHLGSIKHSSIFGPRQRWWQRLIRKHLSTLSQSPRVNASVLWELLDFLFSLSLSLFLICAAWKLLTDHPCSFLFFFLSRSRQRGALQGVGCVRKQSMELH